MDKRASVRIALFERNTITRQALTDLIPSLGPYTLVVDTDDAVAFKAGVKGGGDIAIAALGVVGDEEAGCAPLLWMRKYLPGARNLVLGFTPMKPSTERAVNGGAMQPCRDEGAGRGPGEIERAGRDLL